MHFPKVLRRKARILHFLLRFLFPTFWQLLPISPDSPVILGSHAQAWLSGVGSMDVDGEEMSMGKPGEDREGRRGGLSFISLCLHSRGEQPPGGALGLLLTKSVCEPM